MHRQIDRFAALQLAFAPLLCLVTILALTGCGVLAPQSDIADSIRDVTTKCQGYSGIELANLNSSTYVNKKDGVYKCELGNALFAEAHSSENWWLMGSRTFATSTSVSPNCYVNTTILFERVGSTKRHTVSLYYPDPTIILAEFEGKQYTFKPGVRLTLAGDETEPTLIASQE